VPERLRRLRARPDLAAVQVRRRAGRGARLAGYALIIATALLRRDAGRTGGALFALAGLGMSAYLTYEELFRIHAVCPWCVASAVVMTALAGLACARLLRASPAT
jgi:uncharacterized membrane protein